jgi:hypothetical protein
MSIKIFNSVPDYLTDLVHDKKQLTEEVKWGIGVWIGFSWLRKFPFHDHMSRVVNLQVS